MAGELTLARRLEIARAAWPERATYADSQLAFETLEVEIVIDGGFLVSQDEAKRKLILDMARKVLEEPKP